MRSALAPVKKIIMRRALTPDYAGRMFPPMSCTGKGYPMTTMSKAALPPIQPSVSERDRLHPLFPTYDAYRAGMSCKLLEADSFSGWLFQRERNAAQAAIAEHHLFPEFQRWMRATKAGGRPCPGNRVFPENFQFWIGGGRW